jgi:hypothetical protein
MVRLLPLAILSALLSLGCGGKEVLFTSDITGAVTDLSGNPVRGARVWTADGETITSVSGAYVLERVREGDVVVQAEILRDGVRYSGQNVARTFPYERSQNVNIAVSPDSTQARLGGYVRDNTGAPLESARVFAYGGALTSQLAITDRTGWYEMAGLAQGVQYVVSAGGRGYRSAQAVITITSNAGHRLDLTVGQPGNPKLPAPANLSAVSWVSPITRSSEQDCETYDWIKRMIDPRRALLGPRRPHGRGPTSFVEVDLFWDPVQSSDLLGYGVYRATNPNGPADYVDFCDEPLGATYVDLDARLAYNSIYYYQITALNTIYPDDPNRSESAPSNLVGVLTLNPLVLGPVGSNPVTFTWSGGSGAEAYIVYLFDEFPKINVTSFWNTEDRPTDQLFQTYDGPPLVSGRRYYFLVLGIANQATARNLSDIGSFAAP